MRRYEITKDAENTLQFNYDLLIGSPEGTVITVDISKLAKQNNKMTSTNKTIDMLSSYIKDRYEEDYGKEINNLKTRTYKYSGSVKIDVWRSTMGAIKKEENNEKKNNSLVDLYEDIYRDFRHLNNGESLIISKKEISNKYDLGDIKNLSQSLRSAIIYRAKSNGESYAVKMKSTKGGEIVYTKEYRSIYDGGELQKKEKVIERDGVWGRGKLLQVVRSLSEAQHQILTMMDSDKSDWDKELSNVLWMVSSSMRA